MNDEIREILQELENMYEISELEEQVNNINKIRDYITNLQQIEQDHKETNARLMSELAKLEEENEYLKKHQRFHKKFDDEYIFCVEGDKETYKDLLLEKQEELEDYKSRCEKASEYIKEHIRIDDEYPDYMEILIEERDELLNILQN